MENKFEIISIPHANFEECKVNIFWNKQIICQLNKKEDFNSIEIKLFFEIYTPEKPTIKFLLADFFEVLKQAKELLIKEY